MDDGLPVGVGADEAPMSDCPKDVHEHAEAQGLCLFSVLAGDAAETARRDSVMRFPTSLKRALDGGWSSDTFAAQGEVQGIHLHRLLLCGCHGDQLLPGLAGPISSSVVLQSSPALHNTPIYSGSAFQFSFSTFFHLVSCIYVLGKNIFGVWPCRQQGELQHQQGATSSSAPPPPAMKQMVSENS